MTKQTIPHRRFFMQQALAILAASVVAGCGQNDTTSEQTPKEVEADIHALLDELRTKGVIAAKASGYVFLPSRWRAQNKQDEDLKSLEATLKKTPFTVIGPIKLAARWALVDYIEIGGEKYQPDKPWLFFYFAKKWAWVSPGEFKDPAIKGMMDLRFDRLYRQWEIEHGIELQS